MSEKYIFSMSRVSKKYPPDKVVLKDINLSFFYGAKIGVLGLNGTGKSTLLRIMAGEEKEFTGEARPADGATIGYLPQEPQLDSSLTVKENVFNAIGEAAEALNRFEEISNELGNPEITPEQMETLIEEQSTLQTVIDASGGWELEHTVEIAMEALRLPPGDSGVEHLSGGERRRVALCGLLLRKPDILLLDEPTNHLDAESVLWLEQFLQKYEGTVVAITHDRYFLDNSAEWILELDRGKGIPWKGNYTSWLEQKEERLRQEEKGQDARRKTLERELEWIKMAPKARRGKSKARINSYEALLSQDAPQKLKELEIFIPPGPRLGDVVIEAENVSKAYGDKLLFDALSFQIPKGAIVGIIGANGAGKSTLFRMIVGQEQPDSGAMRTGETVALGYVDQLRDDLAGEKTVWEEISEGNEQLKLGNGEISSRAYCARFNFTGSDQQKKVGILSGGERNRVHLAKLLKGGSNVLLLDEPSNDLDVNTLRALENAILEFAGVVMVISHDRWFLNRICTHTIAFEGESHVEFFPGNLEEYEEDKVKRLGDEALKPKRLRYKKI